MRPSINAVLESTNGRDEPAVRARRRRRARRRSSSTARSSSATRPPSSGCARGMSGWIHSRPCSASGNERIAGDAAPSGWIAEQTSCTNPGSVSSSERVPPPTTGPASTTSTRQPAIASVAAATRPLGPAPTTTASNSPRRAQPRFCCHSSRTERGAEVFLVDVRDRADVARVVGEVGLRIGREEDHRDVGVRRPGCGASPRCR